MEFAFQINESEKRIGAEENEAIHSEANLLQWQSKMSFAFGEL